MCSSDLEKTVKVFLRFTTVQKGKFLIKNKFFKIICDLNYRRGYNSRTAIISSGWGYFREYFLGFTLVTI